MGGADRIQRFIEITMNLCWPESISPERKVKNHIAIKPCYFRRGLAFSPIAVIEFTASTFPHPISRLS